MSSSSGSKTIYNGDEIPNCFCKKRAQVLTCWKYENPGRRFCKCYKFGARDGCRFWEWYDGEAADQYKRVINGLLKRIKIAERIEARLKVKFVLRGFVAGVCGMMFMVLVLKLCGSV